MSTIKITIECGAFLCANCNFVLKKTCIIFDSKLDFHYGLPLRCGQCMDSEIQWVKEGVEL